MSLILPNPNISDIKNPKDLEDLAKQVNEKVQELNEKIKRLYTDTTDGVGDVKVSAITASSVAADTATGDPFIKAWINFNGSGVIAIRDSYNVTSITDEDVGRYMITWETDFTNNDYAVSGIAKPTGDNIIAVKIQFNDDKEVGECPIGVGSHLAFQDSTDISIMAIGDQ